MSVKMVPRHTRINMIMHWFNAFCWLFLLATGLGLIKNENLQLFNGFWAETMRALFGGGANLLRVHESVGLIWAGGFLLYSLIFAKKHVLPFISEILKIDWRRDLLWLLKKGVLMTLGQKALNRLSALMLKKGFDAELAAPCIPNQGFYNVGQKLFAVPSLLGGAVIVVTGLIMFLSDSHITNTTIVQWAIFIHFVTVVLVLAGLLVHIYMAAIAAGERPAFISMFSGTVPEDYAKHHHRLWYDDIKKEAAP